MRRHGNDTKAPNASVLDAFLCLRSEIYSNTIDATVKLVVITRRIIARGIGFPSTTIRSNNDTLENGVLSLRLRVFSNSVIANYASRITLRYRHFVYCVVLPNLFVVVTSCSSIITLGKRVQFSNRCIPHGEIHGIEKNHVCVRYRVCRNSREVTFRRIKVSEVQRAREEKEGRRHRV